MARHWSVVIVVAGSLLGAAGPAVGSAQDQSVEDARRQREETLNEKARAAEQLDLLRALEGPVRAALSDLDAALAVQDAQISTATAELATARARLEGARRLVVETTERESELRATSKDGVVDAYIGAAGERTARIWLQAADVNEVARREQLLDVVNGNLDAHLVQLRLVAEARRGAEQHAAAAAEDASRLQSELEAAQAELAERRDAQGRLEEALRGSVGDWQAKADELDRSEQQLTEIIRAHQASQDAAAAAAAAPAAASGDNAGASAGGGGEAGTAGPGLGMASAAGFVFPAAGEIVSDFGYRRHPILGTLRLHAGIDIGAADGSDVWAAKSGEVILAGWNGGYGNCVMVAHDGGVVTLYGHMSALYVSEGQSVGQGTVLGAVGSTGLATGPHLHFETIVDGAPQNPLLFV